MNKKLIKELLRVPTSTGNEVLMVEWLMDYFNARNDCIVRRDYMGNVYVTKGVSTVYPCVCAHTDTVHQRTNVIIHEEGDKLFATDATERQVGCGGDDKNGIYLCLQMIEQLPVVKAAFFVSEENGCVGSRKCEFGWFSDVGYIMEFDSPCEDILTFTCADVQLFPTRGPFYDAAFPQFKKFGAMKWQHHPYTDISVLKRNLPVPCLNLPAGYYRMHSCEEYVQMSVIDNSFQLGMALVGALGLVRYEFRGVNGSGDVYTPVDVTYLKTHDFTPMFKAAVPAPAPAPDTLASRIERLNKQLTKANQ